MRCARVDSLLDRYVDGTLDRAVASAVSKHLESCPRCPERLSAARRLVASLESGHEAVAPQGFARRVMDAVYRQALRGTPVSAVDQGTEREAREREARPAGFYRRLGFTFMVSAGILAVSLLIPHASYLTLIRGQHAGLQPATGSSVVQNALAGAGRIVQGTLGEAGSASEIHGGGAK